MKRDSSCLAFGDFLETEVWKFKNVDAVNSESGDEGGT
jgi:hypothetical protein